MEWQKNDLLIVLTARQAYFLNSISLERNGVWKFPKANFTQFLYNAAHNLMYGIAENEVFCLWPEPENTTSAVYRFDALHAKLDFLRTHAATVIETNTQPQQPSDCALVNDFDDAIRSADISPDGHTMCICSSDGLLLLSDRHRSQQWKPYMFLRLAASEHTLCRYIPNAEPAAANATERPLILISTTTDTFIADTGGSKWCMHLQSVASSNATMSRCGTKFFVIQTDGNNCRIFSTKPIRAQHSAASADAASARLMRTSARLNTELERMLPRDRLERQLEEHHNYPDLHRALIWQTLLGVPRNNAAFQELQDCGPHPCTEHFARDYPLKDQTAARQLQRIVSALAHWCPPLGGLAYLPRFVFPFLRVYPYAIRAAFETVATLLLNHGQMWLEFSAAAPPANYLAICENLLAHYEPSLHRFYERHAVPRQLYIGSLLEAAFTEVLDEQQWLRLWDHICTRPAWWLPFCVVAFNAAMRNAILASLPTNVAAAAAPAAAGRQACEVLFAQHAHDVDIARLVARADRMAAECPKVLDPRQYMEDFRTLGVAGKTTAAATDGGGDGLANGGYRKFVNYPRFVAADCSHGRTADAAARSAAIRSVNDKLLEMERLKVELENVVAEGKRCQVHDALLAQAERLYADSVGVFDSVADRK